MVLISIRSVGFFLYAQRDVNIDQGDTDVVPPSSIVMYLGWVEDSVSSVEYHVYLLPNGMRGWLPSKWNPRVLIDENYFRAL